MGKKMKKTKVVDSGVENERFVEVQMQNIINTVLCDSDLIRCVVLPNSVVALLGRFREGAYDINDVCDALMTAYNRKNKNEDPMIVMWSFLNGKELER